MGLGNRNCRFLSRNCEMVDVELSSSGFLAVCPRVDPSTVSWCQRLGSAMDPGLGQRSAASPAARRESTMRPYLNERVTRLQTRRCVESKIVAQFMVKQRIERGFKNDAKVRRSRLALKSEGCSWSAAKWGSRKHKRSPACLCSPQQKPLSYARRCGRGAKGQKKNLEE